MRRGVEGVAPNLADRADGKAAVHRRSRLGVTRSLKVCMRRISAEDLRALISEGRTFCTTLSRELPSNMRELVGSLSLLHSESTLIIGVDRDGKVVGVRGDAVPEILQSLQSVKVPGSEENAVKLDEVWLAYMSLPGSGRDAPIYPGLTDAQEDILTSLIREQRTGNFRSEIIATTDCENGWSFLLSSKRGDEDIELHGDFEEIDLHALYEEGYITLVEKSHGFNLSVKRKAAQLYETAMSRLDAVEGSPRQGESYDWDLFISHASEDKDSFVRPLVKLLQDKGVSVWYDEFSLGLGDSLRRSIERGLSRSRFGLVVISPNFLAKDWPQRELDGLVALEVGGRKVVLPVWHEVDVAVVRQHSPMLADRVAVNSSFGIHYVVERIIDVVK